MNVDLILQNAANQARGLAIDAVEKCSSGHLGLPLGCAEIGAVLFSEFLRNDPSCPSWLDRDKFVLSAGHGSMFLYAWLHMSGYDLSLEDIKAFRTKGSRTPGHPEFGETPGVEATSGPLGQGVANSVGYAVSEKMAEARFNSPDLKIFDHKIWCLAGDGCMQEGVCFEAAALAGVWKLDNLILMYDSNDVTLDSDASRTMCENTKLRFESMGWEVFECRRGNDIASIRAVLNDAVASKEKKPKLVIFKTVIAKGIPEVEKSSKGHGEGGAKFAREARRGLDLPEEKFFVSDETYSYFAEILERKRGNRKRWESTFAEWQKSNPGKSEELDACINKRGAMSAEEILGLIPPFPADDKSATRSSGGKIMASLAKKLPFMLTGAADLFGSTKNYLPGMGDFSAQTPEGRNIWFGIREHAMAAISNGLAYAGIFEPSCATFLTFAGYMMGAIRVAALSRLNLQYVLTHDSIGVGFDGPTHQPVELVSQLRCIPRLYVFRPADSEECAAAWAAALSRTDGPCALVLSRQNLPILGGIPLKTRREGTLKGAYIAKLESAELKKIIIATGSELQLALAAARDEDSTRVVSMPCMELFDAQNDAYKERVLPRSCKNRIAVEAGVSAVWYKYADKIVGTDDFGFSADGPEIYESFGIVEDALRG